MANRGLARLIAVQTVFAGVFRGDLDIDDQVAYVAENFSIVEDKETLDYALKIVKGVFDNKDKIDEILRGAVVKTSLENVYAIDLSILRCALFELLFSKDEKIPPRVVLDEYIELAKFLSNDSSRRFVNGVLASIYENVKDGDSADGEEDVVGEDNRIGFMVYKIVDGVVYVLMIYDRFYFWTLPKGRVLDGESHEDVIVRKAKEEIGLDIEKGSIGEKIGDTQYVYRDPERGLIRVNVDYYLVEYNGAMEDVSVGNKKSVLDVKFFDVEELADLRVYDDIIRVLNSGLEYISEHGSNRE